MELHGTAPVLSRTDGSEYSITESVGLLSRSIKETGGVWRKDRETGCVCLCTEDSRKTEFFEPAGHLETVGRSKTDWEPYGMELLPEIHESYSEKIYEKISEQGYVTYDFFLPGLIIDALESGNGEHLTGWAQELIDKNIRTVNMLGCHDGIPLLDLKGILAEDRIQKLIDIIVSRGGYVKDLHGQKNIYYQVNATYFSALGEDERKMLLARALQIFMPGKPQIWYLDLFAGKNDYEAVKMAGPGGHKEINRTNLTTARVCSGLSKRL